MSATVGTQPFLALARANEVRCAVATLRREIGQLEYADGCERVADLLMDPEGFSESARVGWLLRSVRHVGKARVGAWLRMTGVHSYERQVRELSPRQRERLVDLLRTTAGARR